MVSKEKQVTLYTSFELKISFILSFHKIIYKGKPYKKETAKVYLCIKASNAVISSLHPRF